MTLIAKKYTRTEPTTEPVTLKEVTDHLRVAYRDDDTRLQDLIKSARQYIEQGILWKTLLTQTCIDYFDAFENGMELHWNPVASITSITYIDSDGVQQTLSTDIYELGTVYGRGSVRLKYDQVFPNTRGHDDDVVVTYVSGVASIPEPLKDAIKLQVQQLYDGWDKGRDQAIEQLCAPYVNQYFVTPEG